MQGRSKFIQGIFLSCIAVILIAVTPAYAATIEITTPTTILSGDTTYDNNDIIVNGTTLTIDGIHTFDSLQLINAATLTHSIESANKLTISANTISVDSSSKIDVSGKGRVDSINVSNAGGSYGGYGSLGYSSYSRTWGRTNVPYGNSRAPIDYGVGSYTNERGGGALKLITNNLLLDGSIISNGETRGSGGSIWLVVGSISGAGLINANGNYAGNSGNPAGSGGRIAIYYTDVSGFDLMKVNARGGGSQGLKAGGAGTVYFKDKFKTLGEFKIDNSGILNPHGMELAVLTDTIIDEAVTITNAGVTLSADQFNGVLTLTNAKGNITAEQINGVFTLTDSNITTGGQIKQGLNLTSSTANLNQDTTLPFINGSGTVNASGFINSAIEDLIVDGDINLNIKKPLNLSTLSLKNGVSLTHPVASNINSPKLEINVNTLSIDTTSKIDVSGRGLVDSINISNAGGSYGGYGSLGYSSYSRTWGKTNTPYGNLRAPTDFGIGSYTNAKGGGALKLIANNLLLDGSIISNGERTGSGGSVWLDVGSISGTGLINANGNYGDRNPAGSGGRIAIYYNKVNGFDLTKVKAQGGGSLTLKSGAAGTVYIKDKLEVLGVIKIDNRGSASTHGMEPTILTDAIIEEAITVINANANIAADQIEGLLTLTDADVTTGGGFTSAPELSASSLNLNSNTTLPGITGSGTVNANASLNGVNGDLSFDGSITLTTFKPINVTNLSLLNGTILTHPAAANATSQKLEITANTIIIDATSKIDISGRGIYAASGIISNAGGSYGGYGGFRNTSGTKKTNEPFGNAREPVDFGTGPYSSHRGGGALKLIANHLILDGSILTNGILRGSGGSVWLDVEGITGAGSIAANGIYGSGTSYGGTPAGSGGRIAVYYSDASGFDLSKVNARGGGSQGAEAGGAGTVYLKNKSNALGEFKINNSGISGARGVKSAVLTETTIAEPITITNANATLIAEQFYGLLTLDKSNVTMGGYTEQVFPDISGTGNVFFNAQVKSIGNDFKISGEITVTVNQPLNMNNLLLENGAVLIGNKPLTFNDLSLINNSMVTHPVALNSASPILAITADTLFIDSSSKIDISGKGLGNISSNIIKHNSGGSYGGNGGGATNSAYGDIRAPIDFGSGSYDARGGGAIKLKVSNLNLDGQILSNGITRPDYYQSGGGSGGSIWIDVGTLMGKGSILANGANGVGPWQNKHHGGGGGRVAIVYGSLNNFNLSTQVNAKGGAGYGGYSGAGYTPVESGGAGTLYFNSKITGLEEIHVNNAGLSQYTKGTTLSNNISAPLIINNSLVTVVGENTLSTVKGINSNITAQGTIHVKKDLLIDGSISLSLVQPLTVSTLSLINGAVLTHPVASNAVSPKLLIIADTVSVDATSKVNVSYKGLLASSDIEHTSGGSYGGSGGVAASRTTNPTYGDELLPTDFGTGGKGNAQSHGGGVVKLIATQLKLDGKIISHGETTSSYTGGGSGGSVWLDVGILAGSGSIATNGGHGAPEYSGGGGGGRIAVYYSDASNFVTSSVESKGGNGYSSYRGSGGPGGSGTVILKSKNDPVYVIQSTPADISATDINELKVRFSAEINPTTFTTADIVLTGPSGVIDIASITKNDAINYTLGLTAPLTKSGDYTLKIGPNIETVLGKGMDQDKDTVINEVPDDVYTASFTIDKNPPTVPVVSSHPVAPEVTNITTTSVTLVGTREAGSSIWIDGVKRGAAATTDWSVDLTLAQGQQDLVIHAEDEVGNKSEAVTVSLFVDSIAPTVSLAANAPENNTEINTVPVIALNINETGSGIDLANSRLTVTRNGQGVVGNWAEVAGELIFTPGIVYIEGQFVVSAQINDKAGLSSPLFTTRFVYDKTPPAAPVINAVPTVSNINTITISGTKEANTGVYEGVNNVSPINLLTTWSYNKTLVEGDNIITLNAKDKAGNISPDVTVKVRYDNTAPAAVTATATTEADGTSIKVDWAGYDEFANGNDIDHYAIYVETAPFTSVTGLTAKTTVAAKVFTGNVDGLTRNTNYYVAVVAFDSTQNSTAAVTPVTVTTKDTIAPEDISEITVSVTGDAAMVNWVSSINTAEDLASYNFYFNGETTPTVIPAATLNKQLLGLQPATSYSFKITAVDNDGNESSGVTGTAVTILNNPTGLAVTPYSGKVELSWNPVADPTLVKQYAIYSSTSNFTNVDLMTPTLLVDKNITTRQLAGLTNDTAYFFAVTAINTSDGESTNVTTVTAAPLPDSIGPELSNIEFNAAPLTNNLNITQSGNISLGATDQSGMSRVEFLIDGVLLKTDANGSANYSANWDITNVTDGTHTITIKAIDTLENSSSQAISVTVALAAPAAPSITAPANNFSTNEKTVTVKGTAEKQTQVQLYNNNVAVGSLINVASDNSFTTSVAINEGNNNLTATAKNRGGEGTHSPPVVVTLDSTIPNTPVGLSASAKASGQITLNWNTIQDTKVAGVNVYRSTQAFTEIASATKANSTLITGNSFTDLPPNDGQYYYRLVALNQVATQSALSNEVNVGSDNTAPHAVSIEYTPTGNFDPVSKRTAPGNVAVVLTVNEALLTTPFLSIAPDGGTPISVNLTRVDDTTYKGSFTIKDITPSGTAFAVFSARDAVGNRGTVVDSGATIEIDAQGPQVSVLKVAPNEPLKNDSANPISVNFEITLSEVAKEIPTLSYRLSAANRTDSVIDSLVQVDQTRWVGSFILPTDAGQTEVENLSFVYRAVDDLGNVSTIISGDNSFQVYQGDLPPLDVPTGLKANAIPAGQIKIEWEAVQGAVEYALYRQTADETSLTEYRRITGLTFTDLTTADGDYRYSVASVRKENGQEGLSTQSNIVTVSSDSSVPNAPQALALELVGNGIKATWSAPTANTEVLTYSLYRSNTDIGDISVLTPIKTGITELTTIDTTPSDTAHSYAIVAVDAAGNASAPSTTVYLNFDLLPVATLEVSQTDQDAPVVSWTHNGSTIAGYDIYLQSIVPLKLNGSTLLTNTNYTDTGYSGDARTYSVKAVDNNGVESVARTVSLPKLSATLKNTSSVKRGIMNQLEFDVSNSGKVDVSNIKLSIKVNATSHSSTSFNLAAGETKTIPVIVGGYSNLPDLSVLKTTIEVSPSSGEKIKITRTSDITVGDGSLVLNVVTETLTRGGAGKVQFTLENTSDIETEIILATSNGNAASNELRFKLLDVDNNVLSTQSIKQDVGSNVIRLANGTTVARIAAGATFSSNWFDLAVPNNAPQNVTVEFEIDNLHYHLGRADHVAINGLKNKRATTLIDTSYIGQLSSISPQLSYGDQDIVIKGQAIERSTASSIPSVPLKLVISANGFERSYDVYTDTTGLFSHTFKPLSGESGNYKVSVIHPEVLDRPQNGNFTINRVIVRPTTIDVNTSRNYDQTLTVNASTGPGSQATNLRLVYNAADQLGGVFPQGVQVTPENAKNLTENQSTSLGLSLRADDTAVETGSIKLKVMSDESGALPLAIVTVNYTFSEAVPVLNFSPNHVETGASQGTSINESITLSNAGLESMDGINVSLQNTDGTAAPNWLYLTVPTQQGSLAVGEKRPINFVVAPNAAVVDGTYSFKLHITSINHAARDVNIFVAVTQSGQGHVLFKAEDIYTQTTDSNGNIVQGLQGAKIYLQNERVLSEDFTQYTDSNGEVLFNNLPAGWYKFRATADKHQEVIGRVQIKAGITASEVVFLDYNLVSVEWSVTEITLEDRYSIVLNTTFETDVPAAVVVSEPASIELPNMAVGEVFYGEFTLTNYGLIRAEGLTITVPKSDEYYRYELMGGIPTSLDAKEQITVPFRMILLKSLDPSVADGTGAGSGSHSGSVEAGYYYPCPNDTVTTGSTSTTVFYKGGGGGYDGFGDGGIFSGGSGSVSYTGGTGSSGGTTPSFDSIGELCFAPCPGGDGNGKGGPGLPVPTKNGKGGPGLPIPTKNASSGPPNNGGNDPGGSCSGPPG